MKRYEAVNMKNWFFGHGRYTGFGIFDYETFSFVALENGRPYVLGRKKDAQQIINSCVEAFTQRADFSDYRTA